MPRPVVQRRQPLLFKLDANFLRRCVAVHASGVLCASDRRSRRPNRAASAHCNNAPLQIVCHTLNAFPLQDGAGDAGRDLLFPIRKVNAAFQCSIFWVIRHQPRLLHNQALHRLLVPQVKANIPSHALDCVRREIAVQGVNTGRCIVGVGRRHGVRVGDTVCHFIPHGLIAFSAPDLIEPPLFIVGLCPFLSVLHRADQRFHFLIALFELLKVSVNGFLQFFPGFSVQLRNAPFQLCKLLVGQLVPEVFVWHFCLRFTISS